MGFFSQMGRQIERLKQKAETVTSDETDDGERNIGPAGQETEPPSTPTSATDPRVTDEDPTDVDTSDAAMADEPGEAVGPDSEQAEPVQTEGTEPEATPEEDSSPRAKGNDTPDTNTEEE